MWGWDAVWNWDLGFGEHLSALESIVKLADETCSERAPLLQLLPCALELSLRRLKLCTERLRWRQKVAVINATSPAVGHARYEKKRSEGLRAAEDEDSSDICGLGRRQAAKAF